MQIVVSSQRLLLGLAIVCLRCFARERVKAPNDDTTSLILRGRNPQISYVGVRETLSTSGDLRMRYRNNPENGGDILEINDVPQYFADFPDATVESEVDYRIKNDRWSDRVILERLFFNLIWGKSGFPDHYYYTDDEDEEEVPKLEAAVGWDIFNRSDDFCQWTGLTCENGKVTHISLHDYDLKGGLTEDLHHLSDLQYLDLKGNFIQGSIPPTLGMMSNLSVLCLAENSFVGTIPTSLSTLTNLVKIWLSDNLLTGTLPTNIFNKMPELSSLDLANNQFVGTIPESYTTELLKISHLFLQKNQLTGTLPENVSGFKLLNMVNVGHNMISGTIPTSWMAIRTLKEMNLCMNQLTGTIPTEILELANLSLLILSDNRLTGTIPRGNKIPHSVSIEDENSQYDGRWSNLTKLTGVILSDNRLSGNLPPEFFTASSSSLVNIQIGNNTFTGSIPSTIGKMKQLKRFHAQRNQFVGTLPIEMNRMDPNLELNVTGNLLTGTIPKMFCGGGAMSHNILYRQSGCDAILCPPGTFHPYGAASIHAGCRPCPPVEGDDSDIDPSLDKVLGRLECPGVVFVHGDLDGNGILNQREILRLLWSYTIGRNWGAQFQTWGDPTVDACDLNGVTCVNGKVAKMDLTDAAMCSNGERRQGPIEDCLGLPAELGWLSNLAILSMTRRQFLHGTIPTEFGRLTNLKYLDIGSCPNLVGTIPTELGRLRSMKFLNFGGCHLSGTVPDSLYLLSELEKLHLSTNLLTGTVSTKIGKLTNLKELMWSRTQLNGTIPNEFGKMTLLENLEMYGNQFGGTIPSSLGECSNVKRIDLFNNQLTGSIPESLHKLSLLQILHVKLNQLTGTIAPKFGVLPYLSWLDVSSNRLHGTIPATFGDSTSIKDFRLGGNMIYEPIPPSLCTNINVNGGLTRTYGCDGVICPLGTFSDPGHATHSEGCKPCPDGTTTLYLGSSSCKHFTDADILAIYYNTMNELAWHPMQKAHWREDEENDVCDWNGITCDTNGDIASIRFPLVGLEVPGQDLY